MDFTDLAGRYLQARMDQATQPFMDPAGYMSQRFGIPTEAEANVKPRSTTITYNDDGTQTVTEKREVTPTAVPAQPSYMNLANTASTQPVAYQSPQSERIPPEYQTTGGLTQMGGVGPNGLQGGRGPIPYAPGIPAPTQPVSPDQTYQRMLQAESGGQQYNPQGGVLTSPKGAMGVGQIMPTTAMQPGYGVPNIFDMAQQRGMAVPARDQVTAQQLLANEQLNREFGQNYFNAMQRFGPQGAVAAYNAGPGRVQANMAANQGQLNVSQLPQETQQYMQRVGVQPQTTAQPVAMQPAQIGTNQAPVMTPPPPTDAVATGQYQDITGNVATQGDYNLFYGRKVIDNLNNPVELSKLVEDPNAPDFAKIAANRQMLEQLTMRKEQAEARKTVDQGDSIAIANALKSRNEEGSYIKAYLFARLGLNDLAQSEQAKLGGGVWEQNTLDTGEQALIQRSPNGLPLYGISESGKELTAKELIRFGGAAIKGVEQGATVYKDPFYRAEQRDAQGNVVQPAQGVPGNWILERRPGRAPVFREAGTNRIASPEEARRLNPTGVSGPIEQQAAAAYASRGAGKQAEQAAEGFVNAPLPGMPSQLPPGQAAPAQPTVPGAPGVPTQPVSTAPAPTAATAIPNAFAPVYEQKKAANIAEKRTETFNKIIDTEYRENGSKGEIVSTNRKLQFDILNRDDTASGKKMAEILTGLYTAANEDPGNQKLTIIRDIFTGKLLPEQDASKRIAELNISPAAKAALQEYNALNAQIAGQTLRETAGPGSVSDAEQQANRARNVDITRAPMLGAYNMMAQSQFNADLQRYKSDLAAGPNNIAPNATAFDRDFRRHQAELVKSYREVTEARLKFIQENGSGPGAIREGYKRYPVPEYDPNSGSWRYLKPLDQIIKKKEGASL